jgi:molybdopterin synthase sulfur carrier subunit
MYGPKFRNKVFAGDDLSDEIIILVNGRNIVHLQGLDSLLSPEDEISIFPVVAGG